MKMIETTLCFLRKNTKILLAMKKRGHGAGKFNGVGGKIKQGESIVEAMIRECQEEIGIVPLTYEKVGYVDFDEFINGEKVKLAFHLYVVTDWDGKIQESEEMKPQWFDVSKVPYKEMFPDDIYWLPKIIKGEKIKAHFDFDENWKIVSQKIEAYEEENMKHYIIVKFKKDYPYQNHIEEIHNLFLESLKISGVEKIEISSSNSDLPNRHDLMILMVLTKEALTEFDNSWIHKKWKENYSTYIDTKTIFDCDK